METQRLTLRQLTPGDTDALFGIIGNVENMPFYPSPYSIEQCAEWIAKSQQSYSKHGFGLWAVVRKSDGMFIGQCGISMQRIDGEPVPEIGYHIHRDSWNQGYCTEAAKAALHYGQAKLNLPALYIHTYVKNIPSRRIAEKIGMKEIKVYDKLVADCQLWAHAVYRVDSKLLH